MPMIGRSPSSGAHAGAGSTTTGRRRSRASSSARAGSITAASCRCAPAHRLHAFGRLREGSGREPGQAGARVLLHAAPPVQVLRQAQRLAARQVRLLCQGSPPPEVPDQTVWSMFEAECPRLVLYAGRFDNFHTLPAAVSRTVDTMSLQSTLCQSRL
jgi:hypothetical protein